MTPATGLENWRTNGASLRDRPGFVNPSIDGSIIFAERLLHDAVCEIGHHQRRSALDRTTDTIPELGISHHIRVFRIVRSFGFLAAQRKQVVAHGTDCHHRRSLTDALCWVPFVLTMSVIAC